jgi:hypothetical protein
MDIFAHLVILLLKQMMDVDGAAPATVDIATDSRATLPVQSLKNTSRMCMRQQKHLRAKQVAPLGFIGPRFMG